MILLTVMNMQERLYKKYYLMYTKQSVLWKAW